ncbi:hypothetical protein Bca4012_096990 [Brassica carinata]|uniref:Uncharacterized protein n=2 Tax=Brassica TaxID=3705 RepID=A0A8X7PZI2_BRACI|nr:hypothetical protein Bca52824_079297 [Brassica carinata]
MFQISSPSTPLLSMKFVSRVKCLNQWIEQIEWWNMVANLMELLYGPILNIICKSRNTALALDLHTKMNIENPDEHYFLNMFHGSVNANRSVTWVDWSIGGPHPATYAADNITERLLQSIRKNETDCVYNGEQTSLCFLFARKLAPLMNVSSTVMGF